MPKPTHHSIVCTNQRPAGHPRGSCGENQANEVFEKLSMGIEQKMLFGKALITNAGCMGPCSMGPVVVVYPEGVWYIKVKPEDGEEILDAHIIGGKKVERLELPEEMWG